MAEEEYKKIFSKNLKYYMEVSKKTQADLMKDLNLSSSTLSNWCTGLKLPRMDKVQMLADYFGINKSDLIEEKKEENRPEYYLNSETAAVAQEIFENDRVLFDVYRSSDKDRLVEYARRLKALRDMEENGGE